MGTTRLSFVEFLKATDADPNDSTSRLNMGAVLLRAGVYAKAEEQYRAIVSTSPEDNEAEVGLAASLRGEADAQHPQKLDEAKKILEAVLDRDAHNVAALYNLGVLLADFMKRPADAAPYFKRFLSDAPSDHPRRDDAQKYLDSANVGTGHASAPPPAAPPAAPAPATKGGGKK